MNKLKFIRLESYISQYELSLASGVPRYAIQLHEQGIKALSLKELAKISETLGRPITELVVKETSSESAK